MSNVTQGTGSLDLVDLELTEVLLTAAVEN